MSYRLLGAVALEAYTDTAINTMFKKALIAAAAVALSAAPSFAGSLGTLQSTNTITTTGGTRALTINGSYASEEHTVGASSESAGVTASASWDPSAGPALTVAATGGASVNSGSATYSTNAVTAGTYLNDVQSAFSGAETITLDGVFFNY